MAEGDRLNLIYLAGLDYAANGYQTAAIRAIRHIRGELGSDSSFGAAKDAVETFLEHPTVKLLIDASDDAEAVERAVTEAVDYHQGAAIFEINPEELELPDPETDPEAEDVTDDEDDMIGPFSPAAYKTAMALLATMDGDPTKAFYMAAQLGRTSENIPFYKEVMHAIVSVFPPLNTPNITVIG